MKMWQGVSLAILLATIPAVSACSALGGGNSEQERQRLYYEQQIEVYKKQLEIQRQQQAEYNKQVEAGLKQWSEAYQQWLENQQAAQKQQLEQLQKTQTDTQS